MSILEEAIPEEFYKADMTKPYAETVGDLIHELERLPRALPVNQGFSTGCKLVVYNINEDACLEIEEVEEDDDDDEDDDD